MPFHVFPAWAVRIACNASEAAPAIEVLEPSPSYIAQQPAGVFGPSRWAVYAVDGTLLTMFEPNETRDDVRRWLATKGLGLLTSDKLAAFSGPSPDR